MKKPNNPFILHVIVEDTYIFLSEGYRDVSNVYEISFSMKTFLFICHRQVIFLNAMILYKIRKRVEKRKS
jgi:hypothetical protein